MSFEGFSKVTAYIEFANPLGSTRDPVGFALSPNDMRQIQVPAASVSSARGFVVDIPNEAEKLRSLNLPLALIF